MAENQCEVIDVDGQLVRVQVTRPLTDEEREAMVEFMRWVRTEHETYHRTAKGKHPRTECRPPSCGQEPTPTAGGTSNG